MHGSVNALVDHVFLLFQAVEGFGSQALEMVRFRPALTIEVWCPGRISFLFPACAANFPEELFMDDESGTNMAQGGMVRLISGVFFS